MEFTIKASGALNMRPSAFKHLVGKNVSTVENDIMRPAREIVKKPIPDGASGILKAIQFQRATIGNLAFSISTSHPLAVFVEERTKPHEIRAKGKALRFAVKGKVVFAKSVHHPGTKGKYSWLQAWDFVQATFQPGVQQAVDAAFNGQPYNGGGSVSRTAPTAIKI